MDVTEGRHFPESKDAGGEPNYQKVGTFMECATHDLRPSLLEVFSLVYTPSGVCNLVRYLACCLRRRGDWCVILRVRLGVFFLGFRLPNKDRTVTADCVDLNYV